MSKLLRRLRQRAYDRKRNPKFPSSKSDPNLEIQISKSSKLVPDLDSKISKSSKQLPNAKLQISKSPTPDPKRLPNLMTKCESLSMEKNMDITTAVPNQKNE